MLELYYFILTIPLLGLAFFLIKGKKIKYYSNMFFIFLLLAQGLLIKPAFVALNIPSKDLILDIISPISLDEYWFGSILSLSFYFIFLISTIPFLKKTEIVVYSGENNKKLTVFRFWPLLLVQLIALIGFLGFINQFPEVYSTFSKQSLAKADLDEYSAGGIWRILVYFSLIVSLFSMWNIGQNYLFKSNFTLFILSSLTYILFNFITDMRSNNITACFLWLVSFHLFIKNLKFKTVFIILMVFILLALTQTLNRVKNNSEINAETIKYSIANIIGRNGIEHSKTIYIINSVPDKLNYMWGESIVNSFTMFIPRDIFPNKSTVNLDTIVARDIFGEQSFGAGSIPPGLIAELYINFSWFGVILGAVLFGILIRVTEFFYLKCSPGSLYFFFYLTTLALLGTSLLGSGLSSTIFTILFNFFPLLIIYIFSKNINLK